MKETYKITYKSSYTNRVRKQETVAMTKAQALRHAQETIMARDWKAEIRPAK